MPFATLVIGWLLNLSGADDYAKEYGYRALLHSPCCGAVSWFDQ